MKSLTAVCQQQTAAAGGAASMPAINSGRVSRPIHSHRSPNGENAEMKMYLSKLKDLVPFMPKNRKLSKLEIIQHVIDYICDLQSELETHPEMSSFDAATALNLNGVAQHLAAAAGDSRNGSSSSNGNSNQNADDNDDDDDEAATLRLSEDVQHHLQQNQQQSSPVVRQPLAARQSPNTILPASHQLPHHHQTLYPASSAMHLINNVGITNSQQLQTNSANEMTEQQKQITSSRQQC